MEGAERALWLSPTITNHCYLSVWKTVPSEASAYTTFPHVLQGDQSVWKTVPSEARVTRDEVSGDQNAKTAVWKTVPNYELSIMN